jgi:hypothetical protein
LLPAEQLIALLEDVGLHVRQVEDLTASHAAVARRLAAALARHQEGIITTVGRTRWDAMACAHRWWGNSLKTGRVREMAVVAELVA